MEAIAGRTKTVKQTLYYYFGSKQSLCFAVLEEACAAIRETDSASTYSVCSP